MRPVELELVGFSAYRDRQVVDFRDAEFFALVGATGSGKSSLIDAICFALYGTVPRYDDRRLVAPVITQGATEARVRFTFALDDVEYTAVRVVRRTATGASTREARLEGADGTVLAGTADEVGVAVEALLGLPFEHFTRCVVLPQGEFARFLHDKPRDRQELLVRLLDLGVYERMRALAAERRARADEQVAQLQARLDGELADATDAAVAGAEARVRALEALHAEVAAAQPRLDLLAEQLRAARAAAEEVRAAVVALRAVIVPPDVAALSARQATAAQLLHTATTTLDEATAGAAERDAARAALGDAGGLEATLERHAEHARLTRELAASVLDVADRTASGVATDAALGEAEAAVEVAAARRRAAEQEHLAHALAEQLVPGEPCPVCLVPVAVVPARPPVATLEHARDDEAAATATVLARRHDQAAAQRAAAAAGAHHQSLQVQLGRLDEVLAGAPGPEQLEHALVAIAAAETARAAAQVALGRGRQDRAEALAAVAALDADVHAARRAFTAARDPVVALGAPAPGGLDLAADWAALATWAHDAVTVHEARAVARAAVVEDLTAERRAAVDALVARCEQEEVVLGGRPGGEAVGAALAAARTTHEQLLRLAAAAVDARAARDEASATRDVAHRLGQHLSAKGFERWLLDEAMGELVAAATAILGSLTEGQYEIGLDQQGAFVVTDHHNAGERRLARTLSGGETFLASLALALGLADQLAGLTTGGTRRLEALFLDEGFGTLDADTLEAVATAMEHLGATGRIVGLVTHVRELADRVPVRFEVTKDERTARVERVLA